MTDTVSVPLDLVPAPMFRKAYNVEYYDSDFDGTSNFIFVLSNECPDNIEDCVDSSGYLDTEAVPDYLDNRANVGLTLVEQGDVACYVKIAANATVTLSSDIDVKGIFLMKESGFVLMAMVNQTPMRFCSGMVFEKDNVLFTIEG